VQNSDDEPIVRAVLSLGSSLGMKVVAEGVETDAQLQRLELLGCDQAQGYYFARPMPAQEVAGFLAGFELQAPGSTAAA
jgi:EAL domain-containing protein (putative c-di-GMP-specific phosphodiesterase class I)